MMGRYATDSGGQFEDPPIGTHMGRCYGVIDLGTQRNPLFPDKPPRSQVMVRFELPEETMADGRPFSVAAFWTNSTNEKATLRVVLETWRGRPFTEAEIARFDLQNIVGVPGLVTLSKNKNGKVRVMGVGPLMKGQKCPPQVNKSVTFWLDEYNASVFDSLPDGIKEIIKRSDEYQARINGTLKQAQGIDKDDLPWTDDERGPADEHEEPPF